MWQHVDESIINWLNQSFLNHGTFNSIMNLIWDNDLIKGGALVAVFWFLWFTNRNDKAQVQEKILLCIIACFVAIIAGRVLALYLPFRPRPIINSNIHIAYHVEQGLDNWSSFPSDHAVMFFSLATGYFLISRNIGILAFIYVFAFICFPRIYLGLHYPTDILAGAIIGIIITWIISVQKISQPLTRKILKFSTTFPGIFYALFFLLSFQIATLFDESRIIVSYLIHQLHKLL